MSNLRDFFKKMHPYLQIIMIAISLQLKKIKANFTLGKIKEMVRSSRG